LKCPGPQFDDEIALWHHKLEAALHRYNLAKDETRRILDTRDRYLLPSPDGAVALNEALKRENAALTECRTCLKHFTELVLHRHPTPNA
jgi:hypothetical protein